MRTGHAKAPPISHFWLGFCNQNLKWGREPARFSLLPGLPCKANAESLRQLAQGMGAETSFENVLSLPLESTAVVT